MGQVRVQFTFNDLPLYADFYVTGDVDECILGYDWLRRNRCWWLFDNYVLVVEGKTVKLQTIPSQYETYLRPRDCFSSGPDANKCTCTHAVVKFAGSSQ